MSRQKTLFSEPEPEPDFPPPRDDDPSTWLITMEDDEHGAHPWRRINETEIVDSNGLPVAKCSTIPNAMLIEVAADLYELVEDWSYRNKCRCEQPECRKCGAARIVRQVRGEQ